MEELIVKYTKRKKQIQGFGWLLGIVSLILFIMGVVMVSADYLLLSTAIGCLAIVTHEFALVYHNKVRKCRKDLEKLEELKQTEIGNFIRHK